MSGRRGPGSLPHPVLRRLMAGALVFGSVLSLVAAVMAAYLAVLLGRIDRFADVPLDRSDQASEVITSGDVLAAIDRQGTADDEGPAQELGGLGEAGPPLNFLLVGTDDLSGLEEDSTLLAGREDELDNSLADAIMLLRVDPASTELTLLSIPRDLWVPIAGTEQELKINSAYNFGDDSADEKAARLTQTVREALDVEIHHLVEVNWAGFRRLVDIVGAVEVCFAEPRRDSRSGFSVPDAGVVDLDGDAALAYVRSRRMEAADEQGRWSTIDINESARTARQRFFLRQVLEQSSDLRSVTDLRRLNDLAFAVFDNTRIDQDLEVGDLVSLARRLREVTAADLATYGLPVVDVERVVDGVVQEAVVLAEGAEPLLDVFRGIGLDEVVPERVPVRVAGDDEKGEDLAELGFVVSAERAASGNSGPAVIRYGEAGRDGAALVAAALAGPIIYRPDPDIDTNEVELALGRSSEVRTRLGVPVELPPLVPVAPTTSTAPTTSAAPPTTEAPGPCAGREAAP